MSNNKLSGINDAPAYLRKSRAEEGENLSEVLSRHRAGLEETAKHHGIVISDYFEEVVSGESLYARPEMLRLLEGIEAGKYQAVFCMDIDRLGRGGMRDQGIIFDAFRQSGTLIITPDKIYDLNDDDDEEMTEFKAFFARREYKMIRKRMSRGLMRTIMEGGYVANAPYGYVSAKKGKLPSLEIVPDQAEIVKYMFNRYIEGVGSTSIAEEINAMGAKPNRCDTWSRNSVRCVLMNPTYCGVVPWNRVKRGRKPDGSQVAKYMPEEDWIMAEGIHEPIISKETYERAQDARRRHGAPSISYNTGEVKNPLVGIIVCSKCGRKMQMMGMNKSVPYILCNTKGCSAGAKLEYVEPALIQSLEEKLYELKVEIKESGVGNVKQYDSMIGALEKEIAKTEQRRTSLYDYLEDGTYTREEFVTRKKKVEEDLSSLSDRLQDARRRRQLELREDKRRLAKQLEYVLSMYGDESPPGKNRLLKSVVNYVEYSKEKKTKPRDFNLLVHLRAYI